MKTKTLLLAFVAYFGSILATYSQNTVQSTKNKQNVKYGYLIAFEPTGGKLNITKTKDEKKVNEIFMSATGLNMDFKDCLKKDFFINFQNAEVEVWIEYGNLIYKKNGKIRFRELSKKQRIELKKL